MDEKKGDEQPAKRSKLARANDVRQRLMSAETAEHELLARQLQSQVSPPAPLQQHQKSWFGHGKPRPQLSTDGKGVSLGGTPAPVATAAPGRGPRWGGGEEHEAAAAAPAAAAAASVIVMQPEVPGLPVAAPGGPPLAAPASPEVVSVPLRRRGGATMDELQSQLATELVRLRVSSASGAFTLADFQVPHEDIMLVLSTLCGLRPTDSGCVPATPELRKTIRAFTQWACGNHKSLLMARPKGWTLRKSLHKAIRSCRLHTTTRARFREAEVLLVSDSPYSPGLMARAINLLRYAAASMRLRHDVFALVGLMGTGKSTNLRYLQTIPELTKYGLSFTLEDLPAFAEPLKELSLALANFGETSDCCGIAIYPVELRNLAANLQDRILRVHSEPTGPGIIERSPICGWAFSLVQLRSGLLSPEQFESHVKTTVAVGYMPAGIWYLRNEVVSGAALCQERALARPGREHEGLAPREYFEAVGASHDMVFGLREVMQRFTYFDDVPSIDAVDDTERRDATVGYWASTLDAFFEGARHASHLAPEVDVDAIAGDGRADDAAAAASSTTA